MTNTIRDLSMQIDLLQQHNIALSNHVIELSNYIAHSVSHSKYMDFLDRTITVTGCMTGFLALLASIVVGISVVKLFNSHKEKTKLFTDLKKVIKDSVVTELKDIKDQLQIFITKNDERQCTFSNKDDINLFNENDDDLF